MVGSDYFNRLIWYLPDFYFLISSVFFRTKSKKSALSWFFLVTINIVSRNFMSNFHFLTDFHSKFARISLKIFPTYPSLKNFALLPPPPPPPPRKPMLLRFICFKQTHWFANCRCTKHNNTEAFHEKKLVKFAYLLDSLCWCVYRWPTATRFSTSETRNKISPLFITSLASK